MVGRLDAATAEQVEIAFTAAIATSGRGALLVLTGLELLTSPGIRVLPPAGAR